MAAITVRSDFGAHKNKVSHCFQYYAGLKKKEILKCVTAWMNLKDIIVNELNWSQKDKYCIILLVWSN